jgi:hypothetical protein
LVVFFFRDEMSAADLHVGHIQISIEVNNGGYLLETAAVYDGLVPNESITCKVEIVPFDNAQSNFLLAVVALNVDKKTILACVARSTLAATAEKLLKKSHETILQGPYSQARMLALPPGIG